MAFDGGRTGAAGGLTSLLAEGEGGPGAAVVAVVAAGRGRDAGAAATLRPCWDVGWDDSAREKSSPIVRTVWHPVMSDSPTATVCVIRPLNVILYPNTCRIPAS